MCCVKRRLQRRYYRHYDFKRCCSAIGKGGGSTIVYYLKCLLSDFLSRLYLVIRHPQVTAPALDPTRCFKVANCRSASSRRIRTLDRTDSVERQVPQGAEQLGVTSPLIDGAGVHGLAYLGVARGENRTFVVVVLETGRIERQADRLQ